MKSNTETMNANTLGKKFFDFYTKSTITMDLYARDRINVKCTTGCATNKKFHFGTSAAALFTQMNGTWAILKVLCYIAGIGAGVSLLVMAYVVYLKHRAT